MHGVNLSGWSLKCLLSLDLKVLMEGALTMASGKLFQVLMMRCLRVVACFVVLARCFVSLSECPLVFDICNGGRMSV